MQTTRSPGAGPDGVCRVGGQEQAVQHGWVCTQGEQATYAPVRAWGVHLQCRAQEEVALGAHACSGSACTCDGCCRAWTPARLCVERCCTGWHLPNYKALTTMRHVCACT